MRSNPDDLKISVQYAGLLSELTDCTDEEIVVPAGFSLYDLVSILGEKHGVRFKEEVFDSERVRLRPGVAVLVNGAAPELESRLNTGDQVTFFMALVGG